MSTVAPFPCVWTGETFVPEDRHLRRVREAYGAGEVVTLEEHEEHSTRSRGHYFATVNEAWKNLREEDAERFAAPDALRKYALMRTGWRDERTFVCSSAAEAVRLAAFMRPMDDYAIITAVEAVVRVWTPKSQKLRAMGAADFAKSKADVLDFLATMIGVEPTTLARQAEHA